MVAAAHPYSTIVPTMKTLASDVRPIGIPRIGSGKASVNAAAANSARRPASAEGERPSSARLAAAAATATAAPTVTGSTIESTPGSCVAAFVLTWSTARLPSLGGRPRLVACLGFSTQSSALSRFFLLLVHPGRQLEGPFVRGAVVHRLAVRDDHVLERELEQRPQRRKHSLLVPRRSPNAKLAAPFGQCVGEDEGALLRQPERRLVAATAVVQGDEPAGELGPRFDPLQLGLVLVAGPEEVRAEGARVVAADEEVDVADVIGFRMTTSVPADWRRAASRPPILRAARSDRAARPLRPTPRTSMSPVAPSPLRRASRDAVRARSRDRSSHRVPRLSRSEYFQSR